MRKSAEMKHRAKAQVIRHNSGEYADRSEAAHRKVSNAGSRGAGCEHQQPDGYQPGVVTGLSNCDSTRATLCFVHEPKSHFRTDTITGKRPFPQQAM